MKKGLLIFFILCLTLLTISIVSANYTDNYENNNYNLIERNNESSNDLYLYTENNKEINNVDKTLKEDYNDIKEGDDCCTSIIQGYNNDSALSFRRDSEAIVTINVTHNSTHIKQTKAKGTYFFHVIISKDGWFVGNGGTDSAKTSLNVEKYALKMISNKKISTIEFNEIVNIKTKSSLGHFIIKAPNGTYNLMTHNNGNIHKEKGVLTPGDYIVLPNSPKYFHKGNYIKYTGIKSIVLASRRLNALDAYTSLRHDIITYYYNPKAYATVKITATNDDGHYVGKNSVKYVDSINTNTRFISSKDIPKLDNWIDVDEVYLTYKKMKTNIEITKLISKNNSVLLKAFVNDQYGNPVNEGKVCFIVNNKTLTDSNGNIIYSNVNNGLATYKYVESKYYQNSNISYLVKYIENTKYLEGISNSSLIIFDLINFKTDHDKQTQYNTNLTITTKITSKNNNTPISEGKIYYKINDNIIKNSKGNTIYIKPTNGTTKFNLQLNKQYKPDTYKITTIYTNNLYCIENDSFVTVNEN